MKDAVLERLFLRYRERGDGRALAAVFDLTAKELLAVAAHLSRGAGEAEDLVQIVFLRAMERAKSFDPALGLRPWLHGILWREALATRRRAARRVEPAELARSASEDPAEIVETRELPAAVRDALERLPHRYREVVEPLLLEEKPAHEIAAKLGRSSGTVRMQIHRGLERLRRSLPRGLSVPGLALLPTRGWDELRASVLREAGVTSATVGAISTSMLATQAALVAVPALWLVVLLASGAALAATQPRWMPFFTSTPPPQVAAANDPRENEPMKPSSLLALPLVLGPSSPTVSTALGPQDNREPVAVETVAEKVAQLDELVGELLTFSTQQNADADVAWKGLLAAKGRIDEEIRRRANASRPTPADYALTKGWVEAVSQLADPARRDAALDEIMAALEQTPERQLAACNALAQLGQVKYDKQLFREPVLALARSSTGQLRVAALYALYNTEHRPEDLSLALELADDASPAVLESGVHLLFMFSGADLTGAAGAAALRILQADTGRRGINGVWGAKVSPEIAAFLMEMSRSSDGEASHAAIYFGLSTLANKSREIVERLIDLAGGTDYENAWRSRWGLGFGVSAEDGALVATGMQHLFEARSEPSLQVELLELIGKYATSDYLPWLQRIESDAAQPDSVREAAREALAAVQQR